VNAAEFWRWINSFPPKSGEAILAGILRALSAFLGSLRPVLPEIATLGVMACAICMMVTADVGKWLGRAMLITLIAVTWLSL
jgi:hypothetical protein